MDLAVTVPDELVETSVGDPTALEQEKMGVTRESFTRAKNSIAFSDGLADGPMEIGDQHDAHFTFGKTAREIQHSAVDLVCLRRSLSA